MFCVFSQCRHPCRRDCRLNIEAMIKYSSLHLLKMTHEWRELTVIALTWTHFPYRLILGHFQATPVPLVDICVILLTYLPGLSTCSFACAFTWLAYLDFIGTFPLCVIDVHFAGLPTWHLLTSRVLINLHCLMRNRCVSWSVYLLAWECSRVIISPVVFVSLFCQWSGYHSKTGSPFISSMLWEGDALKNGSPHKAFDWLTLWSS